MNRVLFVCLGNICRSPAAEGVFLNLLKKRSVVSEFKVDSAGTSGHHVGERADARMIKHALKRGIELPSRSRKLIAQDFKNFDYIVVMDDSNYQNCLPLLNTPEDENKILKMASFAPSFTQTEVPDPYFGGAEGFEIVLDMVEEASQNLLNHILSDVQTSIRKG
jgi:protein-tyrosine phosphatase